MSSVDDALHDERPLLAIMVERARRHTGSKMAAYEVVANAVGRSVSWVCKALGRNPDIGLKHHVWENIHAAYDAMCERLDADAARDRAEVLALREARHAARRQSVQTSEMGDRGSVGAGPSMDGEV